jgi:hypothetical protein
MTRYLFLFSFYRMDEVPEILRPEEKSFLYLPLPLQLQKGLEQLRRVESRRAADKPADQRDIQLPGKTLQQRGFSGAIVTDENSDPLP